jgi:nitroreductase
MTAQVPARDAWLSAIEAATHAPSIHNTQPWQFGLSHGRVELHGDSARQLPATDPHGQALRLSCGAALYNLRIGLARAGWSSRVTLLPDPAQATLLARVEPDRPRPASPEESTLYEAIWRRHSNRGPFLDTAVPLDVRTRLATAARAEGAWLDMLSGTAAVSVVAELLRTADEILMADPAYRRELADWTRGGGPTVDGVPSAVGGPAPEPQDMLVRRDFAGPARAPGRDYEPEPLVGVLGAFGGTHRDDLVAGQALQRVLLTATRAGLVTSMMSQPVDVPAVREQLRIGLRRDGPPKMLIRVGYGVPGAPTPRRDVADVLREPDMVGGRPGSSAPGAIQGRNE